MNKKLYVGGLPYSVTEDKLQEIFSAHGTVDSARVITDRFTGRSRGFGFVEMSSEEEAQTAIDSLNGSDLDGRSLTVNEARPQENRGGGGGGGGGDRWEVATSEAQVPFPHSPVQIRGIRGTIGVPATGIARPEYSGSLASPLQVSHRRYSLLPRHEHHLRPDPAQRKRC